MNCTSFGDDAKIFFTKLSESKDLASPTLVCLGETKVLPKDLKSIRKYLNKIGWIITVSSAYIKNVKASSGVMIAHRAGTQASCHYTTIEDPEEILKGRWVANQIRLQNSTLTIGYVYLEVGVEMDGDRDRLCLISSFLKGLKGPWLVTGDWNIDAADMANSDWLAALGGMVIVPEGYQQGIRTIQYAISSITLQGAVRVKPDLVQGWATHTGLHVEIDRKAVTASIRQQWTPRTFDKVQGPTQYPWADYRRWALHIYNNSEYKPILGHNLDISAEKFSAENIHYQCSDIEGYKTILGKSCDISAEKFSAETIDYQCSGIEGCPIRKEDTSEALTRDGGLIYSDDPNGTRAHEP